MEIIKNKELISFTYIGKLERWLLLNQKNYFENTDNRATHWRDFCFFGNKCDRKHLILNKEVLLIDRNYKDDGIWKHCYVICRVFGSHKNPKPKVEHVAKVIKISRLNYNFWRNGYFLLPSLEHIEMTNGCGKKEIKRVSGRWLSCGEKEDLSLPTTYCNNCAEKIR